MGPTGAISNGLLALCFNQPSALTRSCFVTAMCDDDNYGSGLCDQYICHSSELRRDTEYIL